MLDLNEGVTKEQVMTEIGKHNKLAEGEIMGEFSAETSKAVKTGGSTQAG